MNLWENMLDSRCARWSQDTSSVVPQYGTIVHAWQTFRLLLDLHTEVIQLNAIVHKRKLNLIPKTLLFLLNADFQGPCQYRSTNLACAGKVSCEEGGT
jgi:hypothetical protein